MNAEAQRLLAEKNQLEKEEVILKKIIDQVKRQLSALEVSQFEWLVWVLIYVYNDQVEQLDIKNRIPVARISPIENLLYQPPPKETENSIPEINLDVLGQLSSGNFAVDQGEVEEEEDSDE